MQVESHERVSLEVNSWASAHLEKFLNERRRFYNARLARRLRVPARWYRGLVAAEFRRLIPEGGRVIEIGCGLGDLLAAVKPAEGVGVDFCPVAIAAARELHPALEFHVAEAAETGLAGEFDYIILSDLINDLPDVQRVFEHARRLTHPQTRLVLNFTNQLWYPILRAAELMGLKQRKPPQNWLSVPDVSNLLMIAGWEVVRKDTRILWPLKTPLWAAFCNRFLAPLLRPFCLSDFIVARPRPQGSANPWPVESGESPGGARETRLAGVADRISENISSHVPFGGSPNGAGEAPALPLVCARDMRSEPRMRCSVVIPARNERGNIEAAVRRLPEMGAGTEILFVEGHSNDGTWEEIQRVIAAYPDRNIRALKQSTKGKGAAVREAFALAQGDVLFILDADLTVPPEDLPKFYDLIASGAADFVNGVRVVYPMEQEAMRFLNMVANKCFGWAFTWLLGQPIKDTLCGTKVVRKDDYERIAANRHHFGNFDPFGDFDLLFGAARLNLRIVDLPIRYQARTYGTTNIQRWRHGWLLLRMLRIAALRLKFV